MKLFPTRDRYGNLDIESFDNYWFVYGAFIGALIGLLIVAYTFETWTLWPVLLTIAASALIVGLLCHVAIEIAYDRKGRDMSVANSREIADFTDINVD